MDGGRTAERIALIHVMQETDTFNSVPTTLTDFEAVALLEGDRVLDRIDPAGPIAGYLEAVRSSGRVVETVPVIRADAQSGGRLTREALDALSAMIRTHLSAALPVDGLVVFLHGAAAAVGVDDVEGFLLSAVREVAGRSVPLALMLDHHANVTEEMVSQVDLLMAFRTQPHDPYETAFDLTCLALRLLSGEIRPTIAWRKIPMITHQEQYLTARGPMKEWFDLARAVEAQGRALSVSLFPMQPWLDVDEAGWSVVVVTDDDQATAEAIADELATHAWNSRHRFMERESVPLARAIEQAESAESATVLLSDTGDSVLGGSPGDSTVILAALLETPLVHRALVPVTDPIAARVLHARRPGESVTLELGGWSGPFSSPVRVTGTLMARGDGVVALAGLPQGSIDMGRTAILECGKVTVLVSEHPGVGGIHPDVYRHFGVEPSEYKIIVVKTASNFQYMGAITRTFIRVATPGPTQSDVHSLPWSRLPRPIFPLDDLTVWRP